MTWPPLCPCWSCRKSFSKESKLTSTTKSNFSTCIVCAMAASLELSSGVGWAGARRPGEARGGCEFGAGGGSEAACWTISAEVGPEGGGIGCSRMVEARSSTASRNPSRITGRLVCCLSQATPPLRWKMIKLSPWFSISYPTRTREGRRGSTQSTEETRHAARWSVRWRS